MKSCSLRESIRGCSILFQSTLKCLHFIVCRHGTVALYDVMAWRHDVAPWRGVMAQRGHGLLVSKCWRVLFSLRGNLAIRPKFPRHVCTPRNYFRIYGRCTESKTTWPVVPALFRNLKNLPQDVFTLFRQKI